MSTLIRTLNGSSERMVERAFAVGFATIGCSLLWLLAAVVTGRV